MKLVLTRNWIVKVGMYDLDFARQSDAHLVVYSADTHDTGGNGYSSVVQFINVKVMFLNDSKTFSFRYIIRQYLFEFEFKKHELFSNR